MARVVKEEDFRYLPISDRDRLWGLYVTAVGRIVQAMPGRPNLGHPSPYYYVWEKGRVLPADYGVLYITQGTGEFESDQTGLVSVAAGDVVFLFPGVWHRYRPTAGRAWTYHWVHFGGEVIDSLVARKFFTPDAPVLKTGVDEAILHPYLKLFDWAHTTPPGYQQLMSGGVLQIIGAALAASDSDRNTERSAELARQAVLAFEEKVEEPVDMKRLAASLHLSYDRFRHIFRQHTGLAPHRYLLQLRINRAKELLNGTEMPVKEIAALLQFDDTYHFSRAFKLKIGASPSAWRGKLKKK